MIPSFWRGKVPIERAVIPTRILVVDDEPLIRWSICSALAAEGFDPVAVPDADGARRVAAEWPPPRVVLLDRTSSDPDCARLLADVRAVYPDCRFILMTTAHDCAVEALFDAAVEIVRKPFDLAHVVQLVTGLATRPTQAAADPVPQAHTSEGATRPPMIIP